MKLIILREPEKKLELDELAKNIFISKYYLVRKFKNEIGLTPHNFQVQRRIRKAQQLLIDSKSITEVANEVGFYDQSHFIRIFKEYLNVTPSEYIESVKKLN